MPKHSKRLVEEVAFEESGKELARAIANHDHNGIVRCITGGLVSYLDDLNDYQQNAIHLLCRFYDADVMRQILISIDSDTLAQAIRAEDSLGLTPLDYLAWSSESTDEFKQRLKHKGFQGLSIDADAIYRDKEKLCDNSLTQDFNRLLKLAQMLPGFKQTVSVHKWVSMAASEKEFIALIRVYPDCFCQAYVHTISPFYKKLNGSFLIKVISYLPEDIIHTYQQSLLKAIRPTLSWIFSTKAKDIISSPLIKGILYLSGLMDTPKALYKAIKSFLKVEANSPDYPIACYYLAKIYLVNHEDSPLWLRDYNEKGMTYLEACLNRCKEQRLFGPVCTQYLELEEDARALLEQLNKCQADTLSA